LLYHYLYFNTQMIRSLTPGMKVSFNSLNPCGWYPTDCEI
jgi:hypothetical protein